MAIKIANSSPAKEILPNGIALWAVISPVLLFSSTVVTQGAATYTLEGTSNNGTTLTNIFTLTLTGSEPVGTVIDSAKLSMTYEKLKLTRTSGTGEIVMEAKNYG